MSHSGSRMRHLRPQKRRLKRPLRRTGPTQRRFGSWKERFKSLKQRRIRKFPMTEAEIAVTGHACSLLWHGLRTMPLFRPKVSSSPDHLRDMDAVSRSARCGRQWEEQYPSVFRYFALCPLPFGMPRGLPKPARGGCTANEGGDCERKRRPSVRRAWRGLETTPQPGCPVMLAGSG